MQSNITQQQIFNNNKISTEQLCKISNALIENEAESRQDYCEILAYYLTDSVSEYFYNEFCDILGLPHYPTGDYEYIDVIRWILTDDC